MRYLIMTIAIAAALQADAGCENSTMEVHTSLRRPIKVYVDGHTGSNPPTVGVIINNIPPGMHKIQVVEVHTNRYGEQTHTTVYNGNIDVKPSVYMDARVDEYRGISIHDTHVTCDQQALEPTGNATVDNRQNPALQNESVTAPAPVAPAIPAHMSDADFKKLVTTITATKYETKKLDTLKATSTDLQLATDQVRQLMNLFSFESNKLEVAKLLYDHTVDKENYSKLAAGFNFQANKDAFEKFLSGK
ncbi:MAG: DUF4476 domain-containing protein [Bacteroidetes bacterium]|nr:DUF4476 domain-containing protein [Bacteroidota bacterium]